jgi:hypothetical protein
MQKIGPGEVTGRGEKFRRQVHAVARCQKAHQFRRRGAFEIAAP